MSLCLRDYRVRSKLPLLEFHMLWEYVLGTSRSMLLAHDDRVPAAQDVRNFHQLEERRLAGEPMAYLLGQREFYGREFLVSPKVLIPRPETELLLECTLQAVAQYPAARVLELGTGSGAIAVSLKLECPQAQVHATDISTEALAVARANARRLGAKLLFSAGNWYDTGLSMAPYDVIVSNPPYVHAHDIHLQQGDLRFEPQLALTDGADGLQALQHIIHGAAARLTHSGVLCVEHGCDQAIKVRNMFHAGGFIDVTTLHDLAGFDRVTWGRQAPT